MEQEPGSRSHANRTEGPLEGRSTASSDTREDDGDVEASGDRNTKSDQENCTTSSDILNKVNNSAGLQAKNAHEDSDHCEDLGDSEDLDDSSKQGGDSLTPTENNVSSEYASCKTNDLIEDTATGPFDQEGRQVVSTGYVDTQQTPVDPLKSEASTVETGEECEKNLKKNTDVTTEEPPKIVKVRNSILSDDASSKNSEKDNRPVLAKVSEIKGEFPSDNGRKDPVIEVQAIEADAQATSEGSCKASAASSRGLSTSPVAVEFATSKPDSVFSKAQGVGMLSHSQSLKEMPNPSKPLKETLSYSKSMREMSNSSKSLKGTSISEDTLITVSISGNRKEINKSSEAPSTVPTSEAEMVGSSQESSSTVSISVIQKDVDVISAKFSALSTSEVQGEISVSSEAPVMVANSEVRNGVISSGSPSTMPASEAQEEVSESSETPIMVLDPEVQNEVVISAEAPRSASEAEEGISVSSEAPSAVPTSGALKDIVTSPEEIVTRAEVLSRVSAHEGFQRMASQIGKEKGNDSLQNPPQQFAASVSKYEGVLQVRSEEENKTSAPKGDVAESDYSQLLAEALRYEEELAQKDVTIAYIEKKANHMDARSNMFRGKLLAMEKHYDELSRTFQGLSSDYNDLESAHEELQRNYQDLDRVYKENQTECARLSAVADSYAKSFAGMKNRFTRENAEKDKLVRELRGQLEQMKKENGTLQNQMSLYEQQHANEQSRGGSYLDDTKAATPALLVSALNGVKDASNNFVKVLRSSLQPAIDAAQLEDHIGAVSRNGHIKFQYQAYICRILFRDFDFPYAGSSEVVLPPTTYFSQYQMHDLKKTDTVERLLQNDQDIDASLQEFCFEKFLELLEDVQGHLIDRGIGLKQQVLNKQHPRDSKLYVSFCKLAVSVWLLQRLAFSFLHPAKQFLVKEGDRFDLNRMQSVVPLDEPSSDEELQLKVGFYVLPGFDIGNSAIPCEVYVALK